MWSPEGDRIAFTWAPEGTDFNLWTSSPEGTDLRRLTEGGKCGLPVWSPDAARIACTDLSTEGPSSIIDVEKAPGQGSRQHLPAVDGVAGRRMAPSTWSPDGRWLAGSVDGGLYLYSPGSGTYREVPGGGVWAQFLSDSRRLLVFRGQPSALHLVDVDTGESSLVFAVSPPGKLFFAFSLSADNRWIYYSRNSMEADVWLAAPRPAG